MFRLSQYMREAVRPSPNAASPYRRDPREVRPVVIWNLTRRCNLKCRHCYTTSADVEFPGELTSAQAMAVLDDLSTFGIPALILSGGEPLVRHDFFDLAARARELKFRHLSLSTNGTRLNGETARHVADLGFDYVGISLDGIGATNDWFRGVDGAFAAAIGGIRTCKALGVKTGLRFTMTNDNAHQLRDMVKLCESEGVDKFYLSHLVYAGRGDKHREDDAVHSRTRAAIDFLIDRAWIAAAEGQPLEIVTGNNDADAVYFLHWIQRHLGLETAQRIAKHLTAWGGNSAGIGVANIDPQGFVHPDTYWSGYAIGSVKEKRFSELWTGDDPVLAGLRQVPRPLKGRCGACHFKSICGGNTRIRALQLTGDPWEEDPACYLTGAEIGLAQDDRRVAMAPFRGKSHDPAPRYT
mgnify:CR=1 FL=1